MVSLVSISALLTSNLQNGPLSIIAPQLFDVMPDRKTLSFKPPQLPPVIHRTNSSAGILYFTTHILVLLYPLLALIIIIISILFSSVATVKKVKMRSHEQKTRAHSGSGDSGDSDGDPCLMTEEEREEMRRKIREMLDKVEDPAEETDPTRRKIKMQKLLADYPLVVDEEDPDWPEDADGWGFNFDQFFDKITIKNVKKDGEDEDYDSDKEVVWQDDNYIKPIRDITAREWEDTVFKDFNPLVILVHNRYKRPRENENARIELEKAIKMFWETGLPSPRCVAVDAVIEEELVSALQVSVFPEIIFTKAGKILHRDKVVRTAEEWSKIMAFFYYKAVRPSCLRKTDGQSQEKIPSLS